MSASTRDVRIPHWVQDEAHALAGHTAFVLLTYVFRHGERFVDGPDGGRERFSLKVSLPALARLTRLGERTCQRDIATLADGGFLHVSKATRPGAPRSYTVFTSREGGSQNGSLASFGVTSRVANLASSLASGSQHMNGAVSTITPEPSRRVGITTTHPSDPEVAKLATTLEAAGVRPSLVTSWIDEFGVEQCWAALSELDDASRPGRTAPSNPAGWMRRLLERGISPRAAEPEPDPIAEERERQINARARELQELSRDQVRSGGIASDAYEYPPELRPLTYWEARALAETEVRA